jgi:protein-S-isoprenylcysteine O-methyltransferase Ste14
MQYLSWGRMASHISTLHSGIIIAVMLCWLVFAALFVLRKKTKSAPTQRQKRSSLVGIAIQMMAYLAVWVARRPLPSDLLPFGTAVEVFWAVVAVALAVSSVWMTLASIRALDKHWSLSAQLIEGHKLVTTGPYRLVRHPIYAGMLGLMLATALAFSHWFVIIPATIVFVVGTKIRVQSEERLLRETFGEEFEVYSRRVPMLIPRPF